jgi:hypothetical protein
VKCFEKDIKPILVRLKRIWKATNELKPMIKNKKLVEIFIFALSDFEVSLASHYQRAYPEIDEKIVFDTICSEKNVF